MQAWKDFWEFFENMVAPNALLKGLNKFHYLIKCFIQDAGEAYTACTF